MVMPTIQQCAKCGSALTGSDAIEIQPLCDRCKDREIDEKLIYKEMIQFGIAPEGLARQCPKCGVWAHYTELNKQPKNSCCLVACPSCGNEFEIAKGIR